MDIKSRFKNPYFWISVVAVLITALGVDPTLLTSWDSIGELFKALAMNPFLIGTAIVALVGVFFDPSTGGLKDHNYISEEEFIGGKDE